MQIKKLNFFIFLSLILIPWHISLFALNIVTYGKSDYSIVCDATDPAAEELQSYIKGMNRVTLQILPFSTNQLPEKAIVVVDTNAVTLEKPFLGLEN